MRYEHEKKVFSLPVNYISQALLLLEGLGLDKASALENISFTDAQLDSAEGWISFSDTKILIDNVEKKLGIQGAGLLFGSKLRFTGHGMLGVAAVSQQNMDDCLHLLSQHWQEQWKGIHVSLVLGVRYSGLRVNPFFEKGKYSTFISDFFIASYYQGFKILFPNESQNVVIRFQTKKPNHHNLYDLLLGVNVEFSAPYNEFLFPSALRKERLIYASKESSSLARQDIESNGRRSYQQPATARVKGFLTTQETLPNFVSVAQALEVGERTLRRHLNKSGRSYQDILNEVRQEKAVKLLEHTDHSIRKISNMLGFARCSSFSKIFKVWHNITPREYRATHLLSVQS